MKYLRASKFKKKNIEANQPSKISVMNIFLKIRLYEPLTLLTVLKRKITYVSTNG